MKRFYEKIKKLNRIPKTISRAQTSGLRDVSYKKKSVMVHNENQLKGFK